MPSYDLAMERHWELAVLLGEDMSRGLARLGLTRSRATVLWTLHRGGPMTQRALAESLRVSPRNITGLVDALVATGFVTREPHPTDRRATLVTLTQHGATTLAEMDDSGRDFAATLLGDLEPDQFETFVAGLDSVLARLRETISEPVTSSG